MKDKPICFDHSYGLTAFFDIKTVVELDCSEIAEKNNVGSYISNLEGWSQEGFFDGDSLTAYRHSNA